MPGLALASAGAARQPSETGAQIAARIERLPFSSWHVKARMWIGTATFFDAFDALTVAQILPVVAPLWKMTAPEIGFLISAGYAGQFLGAILFGLLAERFGRLAALTAAITVFSITSVLSGFAWNYESLLAFRTVQGIGLGGQVPIAAVYISEIAKAQGRGRFVLLYECVFSFGLVAAGLIGSFVVPNLGWQVMFFIGGAPIVVAIFLRHVLPESPRWLASRGRLDEAQKALERIELGAERAIGVPLPPVLHHVEADAGPPSWQDIVGPRYLRRSLVVWCIWFCSFLVTYSLGIWLPSVYTSIFHVPLQTALQFGTIGSLLQLAGGVTCALIIDRIGRRRLFSFAFAGAGCSLGVLWFLGPTSVVQVICCASVSCYFAGAAALAAYLYTPELYPTRSRAIATAIGTSWLRLASMVGPVIVGYLIARGIGAVFLIFALIALSASLVATLFALETSGRTLEEIST